MRLVPAGSVICAALLAVSMQAPKDPARKPAALASGDTIDQMQGTWKLIELDVRLLPEERRQHAGYCVVSGIHMSFEVHVGWIGPEAQVAGVDLTTGMHRIDLVGANRILTSSLIGTFINRNGKLEFEQPGKQRNLTVTFNGLRMTLERDDGNRYVFEKLGDARERKDFFGRVIKEKDKEKPKETPPGPTPTPTPPKDDGN